MESNRIFSHLMQLLRDYWLEMTGLLLLVSLALIAGEWFSSRVPPDLSSATFILTLVAYLSAERIRHYTVPLEHKAFCYFATYVLSYLVLARHLRISTPQEAFIAVFILVYGIFLFLISFQTKHFRSRASTGSSSRWVLIWALVSIACLTSTLVLVLRLFATAKR